MEYRKELFYDVVGMIIHTKIAVIEGKQQLEVNDPKKNDWEILAEEKRCHKENGTRPIPLYAYEQKIAVNEYTHKSYVALLDYFKQELDENPAIKELVEEYL